MYNYILLFPVSLVIIIITIIIIIMIMIMIMVMAMIMIMIIIIIIKIIIYSKLFGKETSRNHQAYRSGHLDITILNKIRPAKECGRN